MYTFTHIGLGLRNQGSRNARREPEDEHAEFSKGCMDPSPQAFPSFLETSTVFCTCDRKPGRLHWRWQQWRRRKCVLLSLLKERGTLQEKKRWWICDFFIIFRFGRRRWWRRQHGLIVPLCLLVSILSVGRHNKYIPFDIWYIKITLIEHYLYITCNILQKTVTQEYKPSCEFIIWWSQHTFDHIRSDIYIIRHIWLGIYC